MHVQEAHLLKHSEARRNDGQAKFKMKNMPTTGEMQNLGSQNVTQWLLNSIRRTNCSLDLEVNPILSLPENIQELLPKMDCILLQEMLVT